MSRKSEIKEAETYALSQLRALIGNALECDVEGSFEHEDGSNEWDAERIAEVRRLSEWAKDVTLKKADDVSHILPMGRRHITRSRTFAARRS